MSSCSCRRHPLLCIIPPYMLETMAGSGDRAVRDWAIEAIEASADARATRRMLRAMPAMAAVMSPGGVRQRLVHDAAHRPMSALPGRLVRGETDPPVADPAVNEAFDHSGTTHDFYAKLFARNSLDGNGMRLVSSVHVGTNLNNAFWNGQQMAYGDGDGRVFTRFTRSLDVVGHELTHGVVAHECNLAYEGESGALNEHFADVFGLLIRQWKSRQSAARANWLVGREIIGPQCTARALRDFGPGRAYENDPFLGTDPQPKHLRHRYTGSNDNGGVHLNSGIPNHAFYRFAMAVGGPAWKVPGSIWYEAMRKLSSNSDFADMVVTTDMIAASRFGTESAVRAALRQAWRDVGL